MCKALYRRKRSTELTSHGKQSESLLLRVLKEKFQFLQNNGDFAVVFNRTKLHLMLEFITHTSLPVKKTFSKQGWKIYEIMHEMTICLLCFLKAIFFWKIFCIQDMIYLWCLHVLYSCKDFNYFGSDPPFWEDLLPQLKKVVSLFGKEYSEQQ